MQNVTEYNIENLKNYFENIRNGKINLSLADILNLLKNCQENYFQSHDKIENFEYSKNIFDVLYSNIYFVAAIFKNRSQYNLSYQVFKNFEFIASIAKHNKMMSIISWTSFSYTLSFLMYQNNEEFEAINRCGSIISEYLLKEKRIENCNRINSEEDKHLKSHSSYTEYLNYLYKISILGQLICTKVGANDYVTHFTFNKRLFLEKLLYRGDEPFYRNEFITDDLNVLFGSSISYVVLDSKTHSKGVRRLQIIMTRFLKARWNKLFRVIAGYGEKPFRLLIMSILIVLVFAMIYSIIETSSLSNSMNYFFQSFFIFTTFGIFDDSILLNITNKIWISIEIALGIIFINGFIVVLARKLLR